MYLATEGCFLICRSCWTVRLVSVSSANLGLRWRGWSYLICRLTYEKATRLTPLFQDPSYMYQASICSRSGTCPVLRPYTGYSLAFFLPTPLFLLTYSLIDAGEDGNALYNHNSRCPLSYIHGRTYLTSPGQLTLMVEAVMNLEVLPESLCTCLYIRIKCNYISSTNESVNLNHVGIDPNRPPLRITNSKLHTHTITVRASIF